MVVTMEIIWQTAIHTPWWVYLLFAYLIKVGIQASKMRVVSLKKLFIIPAIFTFMSVHTLIASFNVSAFTISAWSGAILIGMMLGWLQIYRFRLKVDTQHTLIQVPGTWSTLIIIIIIVTTKYYFGYELAVDPKLAEQTWFEFSMLGVSGICTGLFIGRLICYIYRLKTSVSIHLTKNRHEKVSTNA